MDDAAASSTDRDQDAISWPKCPRCRNRRLTACPFCGTSGVDFLAPDSALVPDGDTEPPPHWILCPLCDELFAAQFSRRCEWCGQDFGAGIDWDALGFLAEREEMMTARALLVAALILAALLLACAYFAMLTAS